MKQIYRILLTYAGTLGLITTGILYASYDYTLWAIIPAVSSYILIVIARDSKRD